MANDEEVCITLVIDEIESLTRSRTATNEPGDAMRVVNVLLTQLDQLRHFTNIMVLTTSNHVDASDGIILIVSDHSRIRRSRGLGRTRPATFRNSDLFDLEIMFRGTHDP